MLGKRNYPSFSHGSSSNTTTTTATNTLPGQAAPNALQDIPRYVQYTSPVPSSGPSDTPSHATTLPLNLIALIISYLDDIGDIARVTRTSRLLYYMTLPHLYERVNLHSYAEIRHVNGRPEGFGSGSPFMMALNGLVTKGQAALVKDFKLWGFWKETGVEDFAKGRVPDNSMMLNILLRAAVDKMARLQSFCWELDCKPLKTLYQGLGTSTTLTTLTLRFPSTRIPRPSVLIPPMANLRVFKALDIDPMCYPDDISMLMLHSKKLEDVRLHFSPRMRAEGESIMTLDMFFGRCHKAGYKIPLKHFAMQNFFGPNVLSMENIFDVKTTASTTFIDSFGGRDPKTIFVDSTWDSIPPDLVLSMKSVRCNEVAPQHIEILKRLDVKMERFYIVNERRKKSGFTPPNVDNASPTTPNEDGGQVEDPAYVSLGADYLHALTRWHGDGLKHLLLSDRWALSKNELGDLVRHCPNLEQLGLAIDTTNHDALRLLVRFLPNLICLRLLTNTHLAEFMDTVTHEETMWTMGLDLATRPPPKIKVIMLGDTVYKAGNLVEMLREDGTVELRRQMSKHGREEAMKYEVVSLDTLDISVDPIAPFRP